MRILSVATKCPWPPSDGGRLVLWSTLQELIHAGHEVALVAPADSASANQTIASVKTWLVTANRRGLLHSACRAVLDGTALGIARHRLDTMRAGVTHALAAFQPDVVHVEQLQALANYAAAERSVPIVLRMQNVESSLWQQMGRQRTPGLPFAWEGRRMRACERRAIARVGRTVALTRLDAAALSAIAAEADRGRVEHVAPAFPAQLPAGDPVAGDPAFVLVGSAGWWPNEQAMRWFVGKAWPLVRKALPRAGLHVFGGRPYASENIAWHAAPEDARVAFPDGAIAVVPLFVGSGIRMRILEAWARGLPVIATSIAARGLDIADGRELLIADSADAFAQAAQHLAQDHVLRARLIAAGRQYLAAVHDPSRATRALLDAYAKATLA